MVIMKNSSLDPVNLSQSISTDQQLCLPFAIRLCTKVLMFLLTPDIFRHLSSHVIRGQKPSLINKSYIQSDLPSYNFPKLSYPLGAGLLFVAFWVGFFSCSDAKGLFLPRCC